MMKLQLLATIPGREISVLDELRAELETQFGALFDNSVWALMNLQEKEAWFAEVLELLRTLPLAMPMN